MANSKKFQVEKSAGGVVLDGSKLLMVEVENLKGEIVWTLPKGHLEKGETEEEAALREVVEETGWTCEILKKAGRKKTFERVLYWFKRGDILVKKEVVWFLMKPVKKTGEMDPEEIRQVLWVDLKEAKKKIRYPSDKKLLAKLEKLPPRSG